MNNISYLQTLDSNKVQENILSARKCCRRLSILEEILSTFVEDDDFKIKTDHLEITLDDIQNEIAYRAFSDFYGVTYETETETEENISHIDTKKNLAPVLVVIENIPQDLEPSLPWYQSNVNRYLYVEDTENKFLELTPEVCNQKVDLNNKEFFKKIRLDEIHEAVLAKLQDRNFSVRATEIFSLYASILIAEDLDIEIKESDMGAAYKSDYLYNRKEHIKGLFDRYYNKIKLDIKNQNIIPTNLDPQDELWAKLLVEVKNMGDRMKEIRKNYGTKLIKLKSLNIIDGLCHDIKEFLNTHFEGISDIPTMRELEKKTLGGKLVKRIQAGDGFEVKGIDPIKKAYKLFLEKEEINSNLFKMNKANNPTIDLKAKNYIAYENYIAKSLDELVTKSNLNSIRWELKKTTGIDKFGSDYYLKDNKSDFIIYILIKRQLNIKFTKFQQSILNKSIGNDKLVIVSSFNPSIESNKIIISNIKKSFETENSNKIEVISSTELDKLFEILKIKI